jgi:hypothetical protein
MLVVTCIHILPVDSAHVIYVLLCLVLLSLVVVTLLTIGACC